LLYALALGVGTTTTSIAMARQELRTRMRENNLCALISCARMFEYWDRVGPEGPMLTRRIFQISLGTFAALLGAASAQQADTVTARIRVDEGARATISVLAQASLKIERDESEEAKQLIGRAPPGRAAPIIFIIVGAIATTELLEMIREMLRQFYYGGVTIDTRTQPPTVTSDPKIPASVIVVINADGTARQLTNDQLSPNVLKSVLRSR
jgi:hypothetical protein